MEFPAYSIAHCRIRLFQFYEQYFAVYKNRTNLVLLLYNTCFSQKCFIVIDELLSTIERMRREQVIFQKRLKEEMEIKSKLEVIMSGTFVEQALLSFDSSRSAPYMSQPNRIAVWALAILVHQVASRLNAKSYSNLVSTMA
ncbi:unnamed protein product [Protopolystoma xenopodis]|uniref:Uncharacterized protein n=1 Tax=Protopolystoma xenopodis TaxID=117903 RepID=A0A448X3Y2_9PLAT|nr:unnamed protein product [Protopolystoma xenopodis]